LMTPYFTNDRVALYLGDSLEVLRTLPNCSVHCCVTSPPYYCLRSYLTKNDSLKVHEIGSEPTQEDFIATMVEVFREVKRVLRDDGTLFMNLGDSYTDTTKSGGRSGGKNAHSDKGGYVCDRDGLDCDPKRGDAAHAQPKRSTNNGQLQNIPHRVAEALRADGWHWRQTIVWAKKSPMCESVAGVRWERCRVKIRPQGKGNQASVKNHGPRTRDVSNGKYLDSAEYIECPGCDKCQDSDGWVLRRGRGRCTTSHEYIFILTKSKRYFWDSAASAEAAVGGTPGNKTHRAATEYHNGDEHHRKAAGLCEMTARETRNPRSVWTIRAEPTKIRHFASYPSELVRRCLVAGCSAGGCCSVCGAPYAPAVSSERVQTRPGRGNKIWKHVEMSGYEQRSGTSPNLDPERHIAKTILHGYQPTCECDAPKGKQIVLDCFNGIGTTGQTALKLGHRYIGIDLKAEYLDVSKNRIFKPPRWWLRQQKPKAEKKRSTNERLLF